MISAAIHIEIGAIRRAIPQHEAMAHECLNRLEGVIASLASERDEANVKACRVEEVRKELRSFANRIEEAREVLDGKNIHEHCGY